MLSMERSLRSAGCRRIAGVDEAGRGPLAGPVVAAAVVFSEGVFIEGVNDSKLLSSGEREHLYDRIRNAALSIGVGMADHTVIDRINILQATYQAMHEALSQIVPPPDHILVDGNRFAPCGIPFTTVVDGDARCFSVAAASIIAKVTRDRLMLAYDAAFPAYGFARHKGYATREHRDAIGRIGYCPIHRRSFSLNTQIEMVFEE